MEKTKLSKKTSEKIGRAIAIMFNRASMYKIDHPFTSQSIQEVYDTVTEGLNLFSPVVLILNRDQFYIEEEPFDSRLNTSRMVAHFKKVGIQSISFQQGVDEAELKSFVKIFVDPKSYPKASLMKDALLETLVSNIKINHVFYKKITADDEIVSKEKLKENSNNKNQASSDKMFGEVVNMMAESMLAEEIEKSFSLKSLIENPIELSKNLISKDFEEAKNDQEGSVQCGTVLADQLARIKDKVTKFEEGDDDINISDLAVAVSDMRNELIKGIEAQKTLGVIYENENQIRDEANSLSDQILIQLVKKEYQEESISTERLAQILRRMVPEPSELKRLLPLLKDALIEEGMPLPEFMDLMDALGKELNNDDLVKLFQKGAEESGLSSEDLIQEFKKDPSAAADLIYLAAEISKETGDEKIFKDLLVDYIERIGSQIALDSTDPNDDANSDHIKKVIANVESDIVSRLGKKGINEEVLNGVQDKLMERMEECFNKLKKQWESQQTKTASAGKDGQATIFRILEESAGEGNEFNNILAKVKMSIDQGLIDENNIQHIIKEITRISTRNQAPPPKKNIPVEIMPRKSTNFFIEKEINRSIRYETPFSLITFSILKIKPQKPIPKGQLHGLEINQFVMDELIRGLRDADLIGILTPKILAVLLPMTEIGNARIALNRLLRSLHDSPITVNGNELKVQFAGAATSFDEDRTPDLKSFIKAVENDHDELVVRLKNLRELY